MTVRRTAQRIRRMARTIWRGLGDWLLGRTQTPPTIDTQEYVRKQTLREREYQHAIDAESCVLRVSGKVPKPVRRVPAVIVREKGTQAQRPRREVRL